MGFKAVLTISFSYPGLPHDEEAYSERGIDFVKAPCNTEQEIIAAASDADAVLTVLQPFGRKVIEKLTRCKLIHCIGIGYDGIDVKAATEYGICVSTPADYCLEEVSDHTMALILACSRKIVRLDKAVRLGKWDSAEKREIRTELWPPMFRLRGQTLGLIGFGNIPRTLVHKGKGFGMRVVAFDPYVAPEIGVEYGVELVELDYLLRTSDYVSCHAALIPETQHLLGLEEFRKMRSTAYLINTARGGIIDEKALCTALSRGYIAGAGLDVLEIEMVAADHPLLEFDNVILTPHSAHYSEYSALEIRRRPFEEMARVIDGKWPRCLLNPEVKEKFVLRWGEMEEEIP
ncbi:MAG: C-terminal binding protein [Pseudomonadota bacterium]